MISIDMSDVLSRVPNPAVIDGPSADRSLVSLTYIVRRSDRLGRHHAVGFGRTTLALSTIGGVREGEIEELG